MFPGYCEICGNDSGINTSAGGDTSEQPLQVRAYSHQAKVKKIKEQAK